jgi:branched-chain amino acid transport system permease protein
VSFSPRFVHLLHPLKDATQVAFVALILALPLIGFRTVAQGGQLGLITRFDWVAIGVAGVFFGRLLLGYASSFWPPSIGNFELAARFRKGVGRHGRVLAALGLLLAFLLPFFPFSSRYVVDVATGLLIYIMLGWGLNIVVGLAGLLDLGYVAFYAMGAYSYALLALHFDLAFWTCLPLAGLLAGFLGVLLGFPVLRLRGDYLAIVTLGFGEMIRIILLNWYQITGGPDGLSGIPRPSFFGLPFEPDTGGETTTFHEAFGVEFSGLHRVVFLYYLILFLALITNFFALRMRKLPLGRAWEALREDEIASRSLGINPRNTKLTAFGIGATFGGVAGAFFATRQGFISPESFTFVESATILAIVVLGGMGSQIGVVVAATVLILLPEFGRELEEFRMLMFGGAMVLIMAWRPRGLLANREPTLRLHRACEPRADSR